MRARSTLKLAVMMLCAGVAGNAYAEPECQPGGTLDMARDQEPGSLVPWISAGNGDIFAQIQLYDHLVEQLPGDPDPQPGLASSWEVSEDSLTYTFHLRKARFSNGDDVTAEDVKFSLDRMIDPNIQAGWNFLMGKIKGFEIVDASTIRMHMKEIDASILYTLSLPAGGIISKRAFETMGEDAFAKAPVGSGPFQVRSWQRGQSLEFARNAQYWREGQPKVDQVVFHFTPDSTSRVLQLQSGEVEIAQAIPYSQVAGLQALDGIDVKVEPYAAIFSVWLNNERPPLNEKAVRQALNLATPKDVINDVILAGLGTPRNSMIPALRFWDKTVEPYPYDIEEAKARLAKSTVPDGFDLPIILSADDTLSKQTAEILQAEWSKIGVRVSIEPADTATVDQKYSSGDFAARLWSPTSVTSDTPDDSELASLILKYADEWKGWGTRYRSDEATSLVDQAGVILDSGKRQELYSRLQRLGMEDAPQVAMLFSPNVTGVSDRVLGFQSLPVGWWRLEQVCLAE